MRVRFPLIRVEVWKYKREREIWKGKRALKRGAEATGGKEKGVCSIWQLGFRFEERDVVLHSPTIRDFNICTTVWHNTLSLEFSQIMRSNW